MTVGSNNPVISERSRSGRAAPPDLSIVIINWRFGHFVKECLPTIFGPRWRCSFEVIFVNKPSEDRIEEWVRERYPQVRVIDYEGEFGWTPQRCTGIRAARGRYLLMLDGDTEVLPGALDAIVDFMDAHPEVGGLGGKTLRPDGSLERSFRRFYTIPTIIMRRLPGVARLWPDNPWERRSLMLDADPDSAFEIDWMAGACFVMRAATVRDVGSFDPRFYYFDDVDWCFRARQRGWKIMFLPHPCIVHKVQRSSARGINRALVRHLKSAALYYWKHFWVGESFRNRRSPARLRRLLQAGGCRNRPAGESPADSASKGGLVNGVQAQAVGAAIGGAPLVSVCIVTFNSRAVIERCIASVRAQEGVALEIIVVDNASPDGTADYVRARLSGPDLCVMANDVNRGFGAAMNQAFRAARGRYLLALNPDAQLMPGALAELTAFLRDTPDAGIVAPRLLNLDGSVQLSCRAFPTHTTALFHRYSLLTKLFPYNKFSDAYLRTRWHHNEIDRVDWVSGAAMLVRRRALADLDPPGFDERFFMFVEDVDLCYRMVKRGWFTYYLPGAEAIHTIGASSRTRPLRSLFHHHRSMYIFYKKHYSQGIALADFATGLGIAVRFLGLSLLRLPRSVGRTGV
ncbi:MAG: hypothetical protein Kow0059_13060 [Candidatus Sumerlaeia bacterium]